MQTKIEPTLYSKCERAFLSEIARTVIAVAGNCERLTASEKELLTSSLVFAIAAHLSGSSFGGRVDDEELYPKIGFYKGVGDNTLYFGEGSTLHAFVPNIMKELKSKEQK